MSSIAQGFDSCNSKGKGRVGHGLQDAGELVGSSPASTFDAGGVGSLGKITELCTPEQKTAVTRALRWAMLAAVRQLLPGERVAVCKKILVQGRSTVDVWYSPDRQRAYLSNLVACGNSWACPVCSQKIAEKRRDELTVAVNHAEYYPVLVTVTLQHGRGDALRDVLGVLRGAWARTRQGKCWKSLESRFGLIAGCVTSLEVTHGSNGWHPHLHVVFFARHPVSKAERTELQAAIAARFARYVAARGGYASVYHSVEVSSGAAVAEYAAKWGLDSELTRGALKAGGSNPFGLLQRYMAGDDHAGTLFVEYAVAFKGKKQLQWSKGLKRLFGVTEKSDEEAAEEDVQEVDRLLAQIPVAGWRVIMANHAEADLFRVADRGSARDLAAWLSDFGIV